jgi:hypothetical protein
MCFFNKIVEIKDVVKMSRIACPVLSIMMALIEKVKTLPKVNMG